MCLIGASCTYIILYSQGILYKRTALHYEADMCSQYAGSCFQMCSSAVAAAQRAQQRMVALMEWRQEAVLEAAGALEGRAPLPVEPPGGGWALRHRRLHLLQVCTRVQDFGFRTSSPCLLTEPFAQRAQFSTFEKRTRKSPGISRDKYFLIKLLHVVRA